jgi:guanine deaminase
MYNENFMKKAIEIACENVSLKHGGPFGAIVVKDGKVLGIGKNEVTQTNDPTAHAEIQAIREACKSLNTFQLTDCEIYTSCEPCPMCISAIYWARPKAVYYAYTKSDAAQSGFDDQFIYDQIALPMEKRDIQMERMYLANVNNPFEIWKADESRIDY